MPVLWREPEDRHSWMNKMSRQIHLSIHLSISLIGNNLFLQFARPLFFFTDVHKCDAAAAIVSNLGRFELEQSSQILGVKVFEQ